MRTVLFGVPILLLIAFASSAHADNLVPEQIVNATLYFVPLADNFEGMDSSYLGVDYQLPGVEETVGVVSASDEFTVSNGQMTFIPGLYDPNGNDLLISPSEISGVDNFGIDAGFDGYSQPFYTFTLPSTVTPILGDEVGGPFYEITNVPVTIYVPAPEPATFLLLGIGFVFVIGIRGFSVSLSRAVSRWT